MRRPGFEHFGSGKPPLPHCGRRESAGHALAFFYVTSRQRVWQENAKESYGGKRFINPAFADVTVRRTPQSR